MSLSVFNDELALVRTKKILKQDRSYRSVGRMAETNQTALFQRKEHKQALSVYPAPLLMHCTDTKVAKEEIRRLLGKEPMDGYSYSEQDVCEQMRKIIRKYE